MPFNVTGGTEVPLEVFGSWCTEMAPTDLPKGVSPDNQEMVFAPGFAGSRPAFQRAFGSPFPAGGPNDRVPTVTGGGSFVGNNGDTYNFYFDSNGVLWLENLTASPGTYTQLLQSTPGSYFRMSAIEEFGRAFIAISDGLHGTEMPLSYDPVLGLRRVTYDGPGAAPTLESVALPSSTLTTASPDNVAITSVTAINPTTIGGVQYWTALQVATAPNTFVDGQTIELTGTSVSAYNGFWNRITVINSTTFNIGFLQTSNASATGGTAGPISNTLTRSNNTVSAQTSAAHGLQVGFQVQITGVPSSVVGGAISSIVIDNENTPGIATVTTSSDHGLTPGLEVSITGVSASAVGSGIASAVREGDTVTLTMNSEHGLTPGASITVAGVTDTSFNGTFFVAQTPSASVIVYAQVDADSTSSGGTVSINWPVPPTTLPTYYQVAAAPSSTTFQVQVDYSNGTWTTGYVSFGWDGIFYVTAVPSTTSFQYQQYGPPIGTTQGGTVTPYGQCAPGLHYCQLLFLLDDDTVTAPSPPTSFIANGGQYASVSNLCWGPSNVKARILAFSGAQPNVPGAQPPMFYLPVAPNVSGLVVGTATQINDNTSKSVLLDFSDNSLFTGIGITVPGNNLRSQIVLDGALGFGYYDSRLTTWGQRNRVQNLLNMGFQGGVRSDGSSLPTGWTAGSGFVGYAGAGALKAINAPCWTVNWGDTGTLSQSAYQDGYGVPITQPSTKYKIRLWCAGSSLDAGVTMTFALSSASASFSSGVTFTAAQISLASAGGGWLEGTFSTATPAAIPADMTFSFTTNMASQSAGQIQTGEWSLIYADNPYIENSGFASYINNPTGIDGASGKFGPANDSRKIMDMSFLRDTLYILTQDPSGRVHETNGSDITEPDGWLVNQVAANCGALSAFSLTKSQTDDGSASGGEEWLAWASESGARIFSGSEPPKISQEIQSAWFDPLSTQSWPQINMAAATTIFAVNDPVERVVYFGLPLGTATAPSQMYVMNYRELDSAEAIASAPPFHPSLMGNLIATDNTRKWTRWTRAMNGAARMYRSAGELRMVFFNGNGQTPGAAAGYGNVYTLNPAKLTDDDYGQIDPYYVTSALPDSKDEQMLQLGSHRKMLAYLEAFISWTGTLKITPLLNATTNPSAVYCTRTPSNPSPTFDVEWPGGSVTAQRMFFKIETAPLTGQTDNGFSVQKFIPTFRPAARMPVRGSAS